MHCFWRKCKDSSSNEQFWDTFPWQDFFPDISLTVNNIPDISLTCFRFSDISRFPRQGVTLHTTAGQYGSSYHVWAQCRIEFRRRAFSSAVTTQLLPSEANNYHSVSNTIWKLTISSYNPATSLMTICTSKPLSNCLLVHIKKPSGK